MSAVDVPLSELAQRLAQKQSELEAARRAYEARLADLPRRREDLHGQLRDVDAEIQAVNAGAAAPAPPAAAPAGPATPAPSAPQSGAKDAPTLVQFVLGL